MSIKEDLENRIQNLKKGPKGELKKFHGTIKINDRIENFDFEKPITVKDLNTDKLTFYNCEIKLLRFLNCEISQLDFVNCTILEIINYEASLVNFVGCLIECLITDEDITYLIYNSNVRSLEINRLSSVELNTSIINNCSSEGIIDCHQSILSNIFIGEGKIRSIKNSFIYIIGANNILYSFGSKYWGDLPNDDLCKKCMAVDAQYHPNPEAFDFWSKGGICPYAESGLNRVLFFTERRILWTPDLKILNVNIPQLIQELVKTTNSELVFKTHKI